MNWTVTEIDIVRALTCKIRIVTRPLVAGGWWYGVETGYAFAGLSLERLHRARLVELYVVNVHPCLAPQRPAVRWSPGEPTPDFCLTASHLRQRWNRPASPTEVYTASPLAANLFGSSARGLPDLLHRNHDLLLAETFAYYLAHDPLAARDWVGEHVLPKAGHQIKDPDAFLQRHGRIYRIIESGGSYDHRQLQAFHQYAHTRSLAYEVW